MVFTFSTLGQFFALDVESGSVFLIDELTHLLLLRRQKQSVDVTGYSEGAIDEVEAEIDTLIAEKVLFSEYPEWDSKSRSEKVVKAMCLNICHDCNLSCEYCFAQEGVSEKSRMSAETAKAACDFLIKMSGSRRNLEVDFFGGEPLLNYDVVKETAEYLNQQAALHNKNVKLTMTTNALGLTKERAEWLNDNMNNVVLSIDGRKDVHNEVRRTRSGGTAYDEIVANCRYFSHIRGDREYYVRGTYTAKNLDFDQDAAALRELGFDQISIEPVVLPESSPLSIKKEHLPEIEKSYETLAKDYLAARQNGEWFNFFHFMMDFDALPCERKLLTGCGAGCEYIAVTPDGDIYPCHQFAGRKEYCMGNVVSGRFDDTLSAVFESSNMLTKPACSKCWAKYYCSGGCASNNITYGGGINDCHEMGCEILRIRLKYAIAAAAIEKSAENTDI